MAPEVWGIGIIKPVFKKGDANCTDNYRAITLVSCLGKLFTSLLNTRLTKFVEDNQLLSESQAGFRAGYSTLDHIFVLKSIIDLYLCQGRRLFCAFVDYSKAFDTVNRQRLWRKLIDHGIQGNVLEVIKSLYKSSKSCIMYNNEMSEFFPSRVGVRQGENLSPLLFALFLNDMETFFSNKGGNWLSYLTKLDERSRAHETEAYLKLFILLYADDTILLAENENDLQVQLNLLNDYCEVNKLKVNSSKTKVLVFARSKCRVKNLPDFIFGDRILETVEDYVYLGVKFNWNGKFDKAKKEFYKKGLKAMFAIIKKGRMLNLGIDTLVKLFDMCVKPVLLYGSAIWGFGSLDLIEKVHTRFCKIILKLSKFTHNTILYGDLGRHPMYIEACCGMTNFWSRILLGKNSKLSMIIYKILLTLQMEGTYESEWLAKIRSTLESCGLNYLWLSQAVPNLKFVGLSVKNILRDQFFQKWNEKIQDDDFYLSYRNFKVHNNPEPYLNCLPDHLVYALIEFRSGSRKLVVNKYDNLQSPRNERICTYCSLNLLGDEYHFLFECPILNTLRNKYIPKFYTNSPSVLKMKLLLSNDRKSEIRKLANFVFAGLRVLR